MNEISQRLARAVRFIKDSGLARSDSEIAGRMGITDAWLNMGKNGARVPNTELLLKLCNVYPINFWWLRYGDGEMIGNGDRVIALLQKIEVLEGRIRELEGKE